MSGALLVEVADGVARLTINRPERRNALSWELIGELRAELARQRDNPATRVVVLTGAGERSFCAGADLGTMADGDDPARLHADRGELAGLFKDLWALGKPTIARVFGHCLAGGFGLAMACDLVVAADDAVFATPEIDVGLWPFMITVPLCRSMPPKVALDLMLTGRRVDAAEAERLGFISRRVAVGELDATVDELASTLASKPAAVVKLGRDSFYSVWDRDAAAALAELHPLLSLVNTYPEATEGLTAFREKRRPSWQVD
jgi:enoyl-CoA hydratase/carnithine racemase